MLRLCGLRRDRETGSQRLLELAEQTDYQRLESLLGARMLLALVGTRLVELAPAAVPNGFAARVAEAVQANRHRAVLQHSVIESLLGKLGEAGIASVPLKGAPLAESLYTDPGLRFAADLDLLVRPADLPAAMAVICREGYGPSSELAWEGGLPLLHHALPPRRPGLPPVELHWRIHWHETGFSEGMLARSTPAANGRLALRPADELATLLLFFARDSFFGLKLVADLAAWWDAKAGSLPDVALDPILEAHPELHRSLTASLEVAHRLVGLPTAPLATGRWPLDTRARTAVRLANWKGSGEPAEVVANLMAVDWLLTPPGGRWAFARRYMFQPAQAIARTYGRSEASIAKNELLRAAHGLARAVKFARAYAGVRRRVQGGRDWDARPARLAPARSPITEATVTAAV